MKQGAAVRWVSAMIAATVVGVPMASAQVPVAEVKICAGLAEPDKRLKCYDDMAAKAGVEIAGPSQPSGLGSWHVREDKSKMDDSRIAIAGLQSDNQVSGRIRGMESPVGLFIRCGERKTSLLFATEIFLATGNTVPVMYRIDKDPAREGHWSVSTDYKAVGLWTGAEAIPFIKSLLGKSTLVFRFTPHDDAPKTVTFSLAGIDHAVKPIREACKW